MSAADIGILVLAACALVVAVTPAVVVLYLVRRKSRQIVQQREGTRNHGPVSDRE